MKIQGIYKIRNCINGKVYIGQSIDIERRFRCHRNNINKKIKHPLYSSIKCYGIDNFEFIIIEQVHDIGKLDEREQYWMDHYKSYDKNHGYNLRLDCRTNKGFKHTKESKDKIAETLKIQRNSSEYKSNHKVSDKTKIKLSESHKGQVPWIKGKEHTEETKEKISKANKGKKGNKGSWIKGQMAWNKGVTIPGKTKEKMRKSLTGLKRTQEQKDKIKEAQRKRREREKSINEIFNEQQNNSILDSDIHKICDSVNV